MGLLDGKVALITGGGGGIGRGVARYFIKNGAKVVIAEINDELAASTLKELTEELGGEAASIKTDVRVQEQVEAAVAFTADTFGGIDCLINNAFTLSPNIPLEQKTDEMLDSTIKSGLYASWWAMRAAMPLMRARGGGQIVNFYSIDVEVAAWFHSDYNITKSAIRGLTRSAAMEWGRFGIRANLIAPTAMGLVFEKLAKENPGFAETAASRKPLGVNGDPETHIAPVVAFLCSDMSAYVTGELINVDGGLHMPGYNSKPADLSIYD